jgi:hypothetical protein
MNSWDYGDLSYRSSSGGSGGGVIVVVILPFPRFAQMATLRTTLRGTVRDFYRTYN